MLFTARVVTDRESGYSKGFGFVNYATLEDAANGIQGMDGKVSPANFMRRLQSNDLETISLSLKYCILNSLN